MDVSFKKRFIKDLKKIPIPYKNHIKKIVFQDVPEAKSLEQIQNIIHIQGTKNFYRIRKGDYRIGFSVDEGKVLFLRVLHRKDIYLKFP